MARIFRQLIENWKPEDGTPEKRVLIDGEYVTLTSKQARRFDELVETGRFNMECQSIASKEELAPSQRLAARIRLRR